MATQLLSKKTVAARLEMSTRTLERLIKEGKFPKPSVYLPTTGVGKSDSVRWTESEVETWIARREPPQ